MNDSQLLRRILTVAFLSALALPVIIAFFFVFGLLLSSMGDGVGTRVLYCCGWIAVALWGAVLVVIVLLLALDKLSSN